MSQQTRTTILKHFGSAPRIAHYCAKLLPPCHRAAYRRRYLAFRGALTKLRSLNSVADLVSMSIYLLQAIGQEQTAAKVLSKGLSRYPYYLPFRIEAAQRVSDHGDWEQAARCWSDVITAGGSELPARCHAYLAQAYRELKEYDASAAALEHGLAGHPHDMTLLIESAHLSMARRRWEEARDLWEEIMQSFPDSAPSKVYARLAVTYRELGDVEKARSVLDCGRLKFSRNLLIESERAQLSLVEEDFQEAFELWEAVLANFESRVQPRHVRRLALAYRRQGNQPGARSVLERARKWFPNHTGIMRESAELAMVENRWVDAVRHWTEYLAESETGPFDTIPVFPRRGGVPDWFERGWHEIAVNLWQIESTLGEALTPGMYRALGATLRSAELLDDSASVLKRGVQRYPRSVDLQFDLAETTTIAAHRLNLDAATELNDIASQLGLTWVLGVLASTAPHCKPNSEAPQSGHQGYSALCNLPIEKQTDEGRLFFLEVPRGSGLELQVRAGRFFSTQIIASRTRLLSEREAWPEQHMSPDITMQSARRLSIEFGERFENLPYLSAGVLADATYDFFYHELVLYKPVSRLAARVAEGGTRAPVFIECPSTAFNYLDAWGFSQFELIYLYFELRRRGVNAILCQFTSSDPSSGNPPVIEFRPGVRNMRPNGKVVPTEQASHRQVVVPAGMRSPRRVLGEIGEALVYQSGSVVKEFAYDRSIRQEYPISPGATIHPDVSTLPTFSVALSPVKRLRSSCPVGGLAGVPRTGILSASRRLRIDWLDWLGTALGSYFREMSLRCHAEVQARDIAVAHICDHLFPESAFLADAVKRSGGRVVLWPHSSNPVHVAIRRPDSFDEVHAITRSGLQQWRSRFPGKVAVHSPQMMLERFRGPRAWSSGAPLSVVVLGGRGSLRNLPVLNRSLHENAYREFFEGLEELGARESLNVYFKPRGHTGEHEMWLYDVVSDSANWMPVYSHPLRVDLPNMLFVSISFGTSALFEGLSRGIPGLIVRNFPVHDYTTIDPDVFLTVPSKDALDVVEKCTARVGMSRLLASQLSYFNSEVH